MWPLNINNKHYNMGLIGNGRVLAHSSSRGNIEWMCWPSFDSPAIFSKLIDEKKGGEFFIRPTENYSASQYYHPHTNILVTQMKTATGTIEIIDFAPATFLESEAYLPLQIVRWVKVIEGELEIKWACEPKAEYGLVELHMNENPEGVLFHGLEEPLHFGGEKKCRGSKKIEFGEEAVFTLTWSEEEPVTKDNVSEAFEKTHGYWSSWVNQLKLPSLYKEQVVRSALVLKLQQCYKTGAFVAAPTTSLPECEGSERNWDYRYCWGRDSFYILESFFKLGSTQELRRYVGYLRKIVENYEGQMQPLYSIHGESHLPERIINLSGHNNCKPVRVGNEAYLQTQNDVYGQSLFALSRAFVELSELKIDVETQVILIEKLVNSIEGCMDEPDSGIWEFRNFQQHHVYTYLFHWLGAKEAIRFSEKINNSTLKKRLEKIMHRSSHWIEKCYSVEQKCYVQATENDHLDASALQLVTLGYMNDPQKINEHVLSLASELKSEDNLFYRYLHKDDFGRPKTTFLICAFWYAEALACGGQQLLARSEISQLLACMDDLGLMSEDIEAVSLKHWGNFPQAYSHAGLIHAVAALHENG